MNDVKVLKRQEVSGPTVRARPFKSDSDRRSRIENLLSPAERAELAGIATVLEYRRAGSAIFAEGEDAHFLYAVEKGAVRISRRDDDGHRR